MPRQQEHARFGDNVYPIPVGLNSDVRNLLEKLAENRVIRLEHFTVSDENSEVLYDASKFVEEANQHCSLAVPNLLQCAANVWFASVFVLKEFFLKRGVHIVSHRAMKFLVQRTLDFSSLGKSEDRRMWMAWIYAEHFHQYTYYSKSGFLDFHERKAEVEYFVSKFPTLQWDAVEKDVKSYEYLNESHFKLKRDPGITNFGKTQYPFVFTAS